MIQRSGKVKRKARTLAKIFRKHSEIPDLRNPGNQRVNVLKRVIDREEEIKREKENEREERERED